jgi:NADH:ubiquinone oxidoreductase subunit 6 (subunit J)
VAIPDAVPIINLRWDDVLFIILSVTMIGSALLVVTLRDILRCGLAMMVSFAALAGLYVLLGAPMVAAAQVLVYIGAISVLILFAIMLTQTKAGPIRLVFQTQAVPAALAALVLAILIVLSILATNWNAVAAPIRTGTAELAKVVFDQFVLPLEVVSVLLLAAVIGGIFLARRSEDRSA